MTLVDPQPIAPAPAAGRVHAVAPAAAPGPGGARRAPQRTAPPRARGDRVFAAVTSGAAVAVTAATAAIGVFLLWRAIPALTRNEAGFLTSRRWETVDPQALAFGVLDLLQLTVLVSGFALVLAMPVSLGVALLLTSYAPRRLARPLTYAVDLLAAVPSVVYGMWGLLVLAPAMAPVAERLNRHLGWLPIFADGSGSVTGGGTVLTAGVVLAVMIVPVITGVTREVFAQVPVAHLEAARALGATRWETVRTAVLPFGRTGFLSASMLGLGRALGETMALYLILQTTAEAFSWSLFDGGSTIASKIALGYAEFTDEITAGAYIAIGLVLFLITFAVNAAARAVIARAGRTR